MLVPAAALAWCLFLAAAIVLGLARDRVLAPRLGDAPARRLLTLALCLVVFLVTRGFVAATGLRDQGTAWTIGAAWTLATIALETAMGRCFMRLSWLDILSEYALWRGRLWILVPVSTCVAPAAALALAG